MLACYYISTPRYVTWIIGGSLLAMMLYGLNILFATPVSLLQCVVLASLYLTVHRGWLEVFEWMAMWRFQRAMIMGGLMLVLTVPFVYLVVYGLLPWMGQPLHRPDVRFDGFQFFDRVIKGTGITLLSALVTHGLKARFRKELRRKASLQSHFVRNLITLTKNYGVMHPGPKAGEASQSLMELVEYTLWVGEKDPLLVDWRREWGQLTHLSALLDILHGQAALRLNAPSHNFSGLIPPLVWLTLVENALMHGDRDQQRPVRVELRYHSRRLYFHCMNRYSARSRRRGGTGQGLVRISQQLVEKYPADASSLRIRDDRRCFHVTLMTGQPEQYLMR